MVGERVVVVGAGVAGLVAAIDLASAGREVVVLERAEATGGKLRPLRVGDLRVDGGPTVLTMRWVFDALFEEAGARFDERVGLRAAEIVARHDWPGGLRLDLFADVDRSREAIERAFGPREAAAYVAFARETRALFTTLDESFLRALRPSVARLVSAHLPGRLSALLGIRPFTTLARDLERRFAEPRLRQLFGRYATYVGSSPFQAPATLAVIAHVEQAGVWLLDGGLAALADALTTLATERGVRIRVGAEVERVVGASGRVMGVELAGGERIEAGTVVLAGDAAALADGSFGAWARSSARVRSPRERSLSALTWTLVAETRGFPLVRHNVFFSSDSRSEFEALTKRRRLPPEPTVYVCAQDRGADPDEGFVGAERLLCLVNAPATGDTEAWQGAEVERCEERVFEGLAERGLRIHRTSAASVRTTPREWHRRHPSTGGALYGQATHGWRASFDRPTTRTALPGLYLAGGSVHPGAGVPMAALSGRMAALAIRTDSDSTSRSRRTDIVGGTSTRSDPAATTR